MKRRTVVVWILSVGTSFALGRWLDSTPVLDRSRSIAEELDRAFVEPDTVLRVRKVADASDLLSRDNASTAIEVVEKHLETSTESDLRIFFHRWAQIDPSAAFQRARNWPKRHPSKYALAEVSYVWAQSDLPSAKSALGELTVDPSTRDFITRDFVRGWAQMGDITNLTDYLVHMEPGLERQRLTAIVLLVLLEKDGSEAVQRWALAIRDDSPRSLQRTAFRTAVNLLGRHDPVATSKWVEEQAGQTYAVDGYRVLCVKWAESDPIAAFSWLRARPAGTERDTAMMFAFREWFDDDPTAAAQWIEGFKSDPVVDPAIDLYARLKSHKEPSAAVGIAERISEPKRRLQAVKFVAGNWYARAPAAAQEWLNRSELPEEVKAAIAQQAQARPKARREPTARPREGPFEPARSAGTARTPEGPTSTAKPPA